MKVMVHTDACNALLDARGHCPKCALYPDMQSTVLKDVPELELVKHLEKGGTLLGEYRTAIRPTRPRVDRFTVALNREPFHRTWLGACWKAIVAAMPDEIFLERTRIALRDANMFGNATTINWLFAPELLHRLERTLSGARSLEESLDNVREALGQRATHHLVMADDVALVVGALERIACARGSAFDADILATVVLAHVRGDTVETTCERCQQKLVVVLTDRPQDDAPATFCGLCGGGCTSIPAAELRTT